MRKELELYLHIPFCVRKCAYCDFFSAPGSEEEIEGYVDNLIQEIKSHGNMAKDYVVTTVFLGGGTPSVLSGKQVERIFGALREVFAFVEDEGAAEYAEVKRRIEISMEANPGTVTEEKLFAYRKAGVNRISFGLQSANNEELKLLGRIHTWEDFKESYELARKCGFDNINVDLISAIPGQSLMSWEYTLKQVIDLEPEHISAYSLIVEEGTPFAEIYGPGCEGEKLLPDEECERQIYHRTEEILTEAGYHHYEISNYAKPGKECRHNLGYWERKEYLGLGLGAASFINHERWNNGVSMVKKETLTKEEEMEETIFLGLRKMEGISMEKFEKEFGVSCLMQFQKGISSMEKAGLLMEENGYLKLTKKGIDVSNYVFAEILSSAP